MRPCTVTLPSSQIPLAVSQMHGLGSVVVQLHFDVGPGDEAADERGMAHLVEHLVLNATPSYPQPNGLGRAFRACGGWINGATTHTGTTLIARVPADQAAFALRSLAEAATGPLFTLEVFESEKRAILAEIATYTSDNYHRLYDALSERLEPNTPLGRSITGTERDVKSLNYQRARQFFERFYCANRVYVTAAGNLHDPALFFSEADRLLQPLAQKSAPSRPQIGPATPYPTGPNAILDSLDESRSESSFLAMVQGPGSHADATQALALEAATDLLAGGDDCRLMDELRWRRGLLYGVYYDVNRYPERTLVTFGFACAPDSLRECWETTLTELRELPERAQHWVDQWKKRRRGRMLCAADDPEYRADRLLYDLTMNGEARDIDEALAEIDSVTGEQVGDAARQYLDPDRVAFGVVRGE